MNSPLSPQRDTNSPVDCLRGCGRIRARLPHRALWTVPRQNSPRKNSQRTNQQSHSRIFLRQYRTILSADTASEARQLPERCLSRKAGIVRCCLNNRCANRAAAFLPFAAADLLAQQNRGAHGKAADQVCQRHHDLRAGSCPTKRLDKTRAFQPGILSSHCFF